MVDPQQERGLKVCLICAEFFGWGSGGGFGYATRVVGRELVRMGVQISAVIPQPKSESETRVVLDGVDVYGVPRTRPQAAMDVFRSIDADIYHSQQPSLASHFAQRAMPDRVHAATLRDPRSTTDWWKELVHPTHNPLQVALTWFYYENPLSRLAIKRMHGVYVPAHFLASKSQRLYKLPEQPGFLPTPVYVPSETSKASRPTVIFVGRWDRVKRPWRFFELAKHFPDVDFVAIGCAHNLDYEGELREKYADIPNLDLVGYVDQFSSNRLSEYLSRAWILVNTSVKEGLPNTFVEGCAHRCAILSALDPDQFASRFGVVVENDDFESGLKRLLEDRLWASLGQSGYDYVLANNELSAAAQKHIDVYRSLLGQNG
jgi:glycosyltransferase involved in cell wall biosynthesis